MRTVQLYVNNERVDLFQDEQIQVTSSIQNVADISKVFTDFTQTFTLPASKRNNEIFKYYYQSDLDNGFEANVRVDARIEIDYTPFRTGRLQLESAETQHNQVQNYKVTFYGEVTTLKDLFGEDKLADVTEINDQVSFDYTGANVQDTITNVADLDVRFPLISSERVWTYSDGTGINDSTTYAIDYTELFPAVKVARIFDAFEARYGITFSGNFLDDLRFTNLFTWWKSRDIPNFTIASAPVEFAAIATTTDDNGNPVPIDPIGTNQINVKYNSYYTANEKHFIRFYTTVSNTAAEYYVDVYKDGALVYTDVRTGNTFGSYYLTSDDNINGLDSVYTFRLRSDQPLTINGDIEYRLQQVSQAGIDYPIFEQQTITQVTLSTQNIDFPSTAPDIKVSDYFSGVLQMFNLTCYPVGDSTFQIEPLEAWYDRGRDIDITEFTDVKSINYERVKLHKRIAFNYEKSESFLNQNFASLFSREWGSLNNDFNYDGDELIVKPPFENLLFTNLDENRFQVAYSRTSNPPDSEPYTPKPVMLYLYQEAQTCDFYFDNGTTIPNLTSYIPFGQDVIYNGNVSSMNFGSEISSLLLEIMTDSLYASFYERYLTNLFNIKNRKVSVTTRLPLGVLQDLELNDSLIIRDKKYTINDMKSNLTTGQVDFVLLQDLYIDRAATPPVRPVKPVKPGGGTIVIPIRPPKDKWVRITSTTSDFTTSSPAVTYDTNEDADITFTASANTDNERTDTYTYGVYDDQPTDVSTPIYTKTITILQDSGLDHILAEDSSNLLTENLDTIVEE